jgi:hypothetical protein
MGNNKGKERIMKKLLLLLAVVAAFTCTSVAQYSSSSGSAGQTSDQTSDQKTTEKSKSKKSAASSDQMGGQAAEKGGGKAKKEATLTGCISPQPDASGNYTLSNAKHKKGVVLEPADKVKEHAGHQTQLTGQWSSDKKKFEVASVKHISETCEMAPGGGTAGTTKKGKKDMEKGKDTSGAPPKS